MPKCCGISHISGFICGLSDTATLVTIISYLNYLLPARVK